MTIKITALGSCRLHNPLKKFNSFPYLQLNAADIYGFVHTSSEALQQLRYLEGDYLPSASIQPILSSRLRFNKTKLQQKSPVSDLYFVEISSAKTVMVENEFVQMNYIYVYFSEFFLDANRTKKFWSLAALPDREELLQFLKADPIYNTYPKEKQVLLSKISVKHMSEEELKQDIIAINQKVKNVVFVTHCNVKLPDMTYISSREKWIKTIEKVCKEVGCKVYNPTHLMMVLGQSASLQKNGLDSTHYTSLFEKQIFNDLHRLYIEPLLSSAYIKEEMDENSQASTQELVQLEQLYQQGELITTFQLLNNFVRKYPKNVMAKDLFGRVSYNLNDFERAIENFNVVDSHQELSNENRLYLIKSYFNLKNFKEVLNHADLLFEEEFYEPEVIKLSAMAAQALGESVKASIYWEQLYKFENFKLEAASHQALLFEQENDFEKAIQWINLALEISPKDANLRIALSRMLATVTDEKSLDLLIDRFFPNSDEEVLSLTRTALNHQFILSAAKSLNKASVLWPNNTNIKKMITKTSAEWIEVIISSDLSVKDPEQWIKYLKSILLIQPRQNAAIRIRRDYILNQRLELKSAYQNQDYEKAIAVGMRIFFLDPEFSGISLLIARSFYAQRNYIQALEWLIKTTTLESHNKNAWILRAKTALKSSNFLEALTTIQEIKSYFKGTDFPEIKAIISLVVKESAKQINIQIRKGDLELAWKINTLLLNEAPTETKYLNASTLILRKMSEHLKEAESAEIQIKLARSIYEKDPDNIHALRVLAISLMKQKKLDESLSYWEKLCILSPEINSYKMQVQKCIKPEVAV